MFRNHLLPLCLVGGLFTAGSSFAQVVTIPVETQHNALVLQTDADKNLKMVYFGAKLSNTAEYARIQKMYNQKDDSGILNSAYTPSGSANLAEPAITVTHANGDKSLSLVYVSHEVTKVADDISLLTVTLKDPVYNFEVKLYYKTYFKEDVTEQWSVIKHGEKGEVVLNKFASANLNLKGSGFWLKQYHGNWAEEMRPEEAKLTHGIKTIDSKLGTRANLYEPSMFAVSIDKPATEDEGKVLLGALEWSGNFKIDFELDVSDNLRLIAGINNAAAEYHLKPNEEFATPALVYTYSDQGKGDASRKLQRWARKYKIVDGEGSRLTLLNNWESTYFDFNETKLAELLKDTKKLGVDLFLLDDGWFANKYPRNGDHAGLGDWQENKQKLPDGISWLVKEAQNNGVKFGIWIEPEMVNPKSELYEKHPDWVIKQPNRPEKYFRNQLVLDLTNPKVQDFVFGIVDNLFTKNPDLAYIKWDCNAVIYNAYSAYLKKDQSHLYTDYVRGLYKVLERVRAKYPKVPLMLCSGGGGRVDYGALKYFTEFWPSDNTDPLERVFIQWEYSYFYPAITSSNHVTDWGKQPLKFRTDVAMMGKLGFDIVISKLSEQDLDYVHGALKNYDNLKEAIWHGDQYRLQSPWDNDAASIMYVDNAKAKAVMFNYLVNNRYGTGTLVPIRLKGLDPQKKYQVKEINLYPGTKSPIENDLVLTGNFLMNVGVNPHVSSGRTSVVLELDEVK
ncbi:alpha-galactosidase [Mucilaginibacter lappiensis]|uniref:Alpha-galactosidase n=1 Tax=Mucilaginibacter lappiensis TaxID=354630 RepID=A0ABR6PJW5_9SPHI|nr:alpha-galactosidase [Mucilaginibacter lappiensis]MBB6110062.1 alpha-galactosidase [Mucilaginibacter lappiensis]SIR54081.1 alpha-galactosidase [Mucilaginibacter lappiensis]